MFTPIKLDKVRNLRYGMRAFKIVEDLAGEPIGKIDYEAVTMEKLSILLYAGLAHEDKDLTPDKVIDLVDDYSDIQTASEALGKAIQAALLNGKSEKNLARAVK